MNRRLALPAKLVKQFPPWVSVTLALPHWPNACQHEIDGVLKEIATAHLVQVPVWAPGHYTYLQGKRDSPSTAWTVYYQDSLNNELQSSYEAAQNVAKVLRLLPPDGELHHSTPGHQKDGWSCGAHVIRTMEFEARQWLGEPVTSMASIEATMARMNEFIQKISPAADATSKAAKVVAKGKAKAKAMPTHTTLQDLSGGPTDNQSGSRQLIQRTAPDMVWGDTST